MADQSSFLKPILQELTYGASSWKKPVKVVATSNITLSGTQTVDGVALTAADEVLCVGQSTGSQNGVWVVARGAWTRRTDCDSADELFAGCRVSVTQGTHAGDVYRLTTTGRINVGTTSQTWALDVGSGSLTNVTAGSNISVTTPETGVRQVALSATPSVTSLTASSHVAATSYIEVGGSRLVTSAPTAIGHFRVDENGRLQVGDGLATLTMLRPYDAPLIKSLDYSGDSAANSTLSERPILGWQGASSMVDFSAVLTPAGPLTASNTDYATINIYKRFSPTGSGKTLLASITTQTSGGGGTGNWTAFNDITTFTISDSTVDAEAFITWEILKANSGVQLPAFMLDLYGIYVPA